MLHRTTSRLSHVCVVGASGGIGQPLSLLLKTCQPVTRLSLFDLAHTPGVAADLSHISTPAKVTGYVDDLSKALDGADIVVVPAGVPRKPGMTRDDLFNKNASVVANLADNVAKVCPKALVCIITNPVNSTVPIFAEVMKKHGKYDPRRVFGVTSLDLVRSKTFVKELKGVDCDVPVIGGHSGPTIVPLLSQVPGVTFTEEELAALTKRIQYAGDEVVNAKAGAGSATLSMAYAGFRFVSALVKAQTSPGQTEWGFVETDMVPSLDFFATKLTLGKDGVMTTEKPPKLSAFEEAKYADCLKQLAADIKKGQDWARAK